MSLLAVRDWSAEPPRRALTATELVAGLAALPGWQLQGDGPGVAIARRFSFGDFYENMAFVNALALVAHRQNHHPELVIGYNRCEVRLNTHDVHGISATDLEMAGQIEALLA